MLYILFLLLKENIKEIQIQEKQISWNFNEKASFL